VDRVPYGRMDFVLSRGYGPDEVGAVDAVHDGQVFGERRSIF
jgi:hypothetical protein